MNEKVLSLTQNFPVPVRIVIEARKSARIALRNKQIILRIPKGMNIQQKNKVAQELLEWANKTIQEKNLYSPADPEVFNPGTSISVMGQNYTIAHHFVPGNRGSVHISKTQEKITISLPIHISHKEDTKKEWIQQLLIKGFNQYFLPEITRRVQELNRLYFNAELGKITLRYTTSRWGSCSSEGSISLSTKLLLVPPVVCDYVIIHELAHRFEMNHSDRFWILVEKAMPDYRVHLHWLKTEGSKLEF